MASGQRQAQAAEKARNELMHDPLRHKAPALDQDGALATLAY